VRHFRYSEELFSKGYVAVPGNGSRTLTLTGSFGDSTEGTNQYNAIAAIIGDPSGGTTTVVKEGSRRVGPQRAKHLHRRHQRQRGKIVDRSWVRHQRQFRSERRVERASLQRGRLRRQRRRAELYTGDNGVSRFGVAHGYEALSQTVASISGAGTIDLNKGTLTISNASSATFSGVITENTDVGSTEDQTGGRLIKSNTGTLTLSGTLKYTGGTTVNHGTLIVARLSTGTTSEFTNGPLVISAGAGSVATMRVTDKGTSNNNDLSGTSIVSSLSITAGAGGTATLDLTNNSIIINYTGLVGSLEDDIRQHMQPGRLTTSVTTFNGYGTRLGYADNAELGAYARTTFSDVDSSNLLIMFTYAGDATLDGVVNSDDFNELAGNFGTGTLWREGDFTYGGEVNSDDFNLLAGNFG
jgi:autotransporter-associated beta strand protein